MDCMPKDWQFYKDVMSLYIDSAKNFSSISSGALGLTIIFREKIVGLTPGANISRLMIVSWALFLLTIACSAFYQYLSVKFLEINSNCHGKSLFIIENLINKPGWIYGTMLISFFLASLLLILAAWKQIPKHLN